MQQTSQALDFKSKCLYHKDLDLTNFCKDLNCLMPLCPDCMKDHLMKHQNDKTYPNIERIENVIQESIYLVDKLSANFKSDLETLENLNQSKSQKFNTYCQKIKKAQEKIHQIIDQYFSIFIKEYNDTYFNQENAIKTEIEISRDFILSKIKEIDKFRAKLRAEKFLKYIVKLNSTNFYPENYNYHSDFKHYLDILSEKFVVPIIDESKLYSFNLELAKYINLQNIDIFGYKMDRGFYLSEPPSDKQYDLKKKLDFEEKSPVFPSSFNQDLRREMESQKKKNFNEINEEKYLALSKFSKSDHMKDVKEFGFVPLNPINLNQQPIYEPIPKDSTVRFSASLKNKETNSRINKDKEKQPEKEKISNFQRYVFKSDLNNNEYPKQSNDKNALLDTPDYFISKTLNKYLHYFVPKTKSLILFQLGTSSKIVEEVKLNISSIIPEEHRSVITPSGEIFISGGYNSEKQRTIDSFFKFNFLQKIFSPRPSMKTCRKSHAIICVDKFIYVLGGIDEKEEVLNKCEKFDLEKEVWIPISNMQRKSCFFNVISFEKSIIFKFYSSNNYNYTEKYDILKNSWVDVPLKAEKNFVFPALSNGCQINNKEILIFGGIKEEKQTKKCYICKIEEELVISNFKLDLPIEGYSEQSCYYDGGFIWAVLDNSKESDKIFIRMNEDKWTMLN